MAGGHTFSSSKAVLGFLKSAAFTLSTKEEAVVSVVSGEQKEGKEQEKTVSTKASLPGSRNAGNAA